MLLFCVRVLTFPTAYCLGVFGLSRVYVCMVSHVHITPSLDTIVMDTVTVGTLCWVASVEFRLVCIGLVWMAGCVGVDV